MAKKQIKRISGSKYKYVGHYQVNDIDLWHTEIKGVSKKKYDTEREAAIAVDKWLIGKGKEPVNILIRK